MPDAKNKKLSILHVVLSIGETNATYNEHCLPMAGKRDITISTYFKSEISPPKNIGYFEGDNSLQGFFNVLKDALDIKEYDVVHAHSPHVGFLFLVFQFFYRQGRLPGSVCTVHNSYPSFKLRNKLLLLPIFAFFQRVVCCSQSSIESFPPIYKWMAGERLSAVPNGADTDRIKRIIPKDRASIQDDNFTVASAARLVEIKNHPAVLEAFQQSSDQSSRFVLIGDGPLYDSLSTEIKKPGLKDQVELKGLIPREKVFKNMASADLFVSASKGDGLPIAVLEAMACRCPVLLSDIPPHREIAEGVDFIPLVDPTDVNGFAREIKRFRELSAIERNELGEKCGELVEERFSLTQMHNGYEEIYLQLV